MVKSLVAIDLIKDAEIITDTKYDEDRMLVRRTTLKNGNRSIELKVFRGGKTDDDIVIIHKADNKWQIICDSSSDFYKIGLPMYLFKN